MEKTINSTFSYLCGATLSLVLFGGLVGAPRGLLADDAAAPKGDGWPRVMEMGHAKVTVYEPEIEAIKDGRVEARAAFSVSVSAKAPEFGAMRFTASTDSGPTKRLVYLSKMEAQAIKYPGKDDKDAARFKSDLNHKLAGERWAIARDRVATGAEGRAVDPGKSALNNKPPRIFYEEAPAVLVFIDGDPIIKDVKKSKYKYVVNTAYFIVRDPNDNYFYLKGGQWWYRSRDVLKGWETIDAPPKEISQMADEAFSGDASDSDSQVTGLKKAPKIIISTEPAELILSDGKAKFVPIEGTDLLFVDNSENDVLMDINTQRYYVLISGRWYASKSLSGNQWKFVRPDQLPEDFGKIPAGSGMASMRTSVAGTKEAKEALLENAVPQTAAIDRATATVEVRYDGDPKFKHVGGTKVFYAENADKVVLKINSRFYVVDNGVWFESASPDGPFAVSTVVPPEVQDIPPSAPVYSVKYVYVYDYTPSVVYVGYTPGYYCAYPYYGTVVYGTGYYYHPWYGVYYYPWPVTYGFSVHFNPFTGWWGYPVGISYGWVSFGWFPYPYAYWGPSGYVYGYRHGYYHGERHGYYHGYRNGYRDGYTAGGRTTGYRAVTPKSRYHQPSLGLAYRNRNNGVREVGASTRQFHRSSAGARSTPAYRRGDFTAKHAATQSMRRSPPLRARVVRPGERSPNRSFDRSPNTPARSPERSFERSPNRSPIDGGHTEAGRAHASPGQEGRVVNRADSRKYERPASPPPVREERVVNRADGRKYERPASPPPVQKSKKEEADDQQVHKQKEKPSSPPTQRSYQRAPTERRPSSSRPSAAPGPRPQSPQYHASPRRSAGPSPNKAAPASRRRR